MSVTARRQHNQPPPKLAFRPFPAPIDDEEPAQADEARPTHVEGVAVEREEPIKHLPNAEFRISKLHLVDGSMAYACRDCAYTNRKRGGVMVHRNQEHGARVGKNRSQQVQEVLPLTGAPDPVLAPRSEGQPAPSNTMLMTLAEILAIAPSLAALGDLIERTEAERDAASAEIAERDLHARENQHKIDVYETMRDELVELRLRVRQQGNYEQIKAEMYALRAWKAKMIKRLAGLGFSLNEEDQ